MGEKGGPDAAGHEGGRRGGLKKPSLPSPFPPLRLPVNGLAGLPRDGKPNEPRGPDRPQSSIAQHGE